MEVELLLDLKFEGFCRDLLGDGHSVGFFV